MEQWGEGRRRRESEGMWVRRQAPALSTSRPAGTVGGSRVLLARTLSRLRHYVPHLLLSSFVGSIFVFTFFGFCHSLRLHAPLFCPPDLK